MVNLNLELGGTFDITVLDKNGNIKQHEVQHNRVVDTGLWLMASLIAGEENDGDNFISRPTHCAIGTDSLDVTNSQTALEKEVYRKAFDKVVRSKNSVEFTTTFEPGEPDIGRSIVTNTDGSTYNVSNGGYCRIEEVALFNADKEGVMFNRCVFNTISKGWDDTLIVKYTITVNAVTSPYDSLWDDLTP